MTRIHTLFTRREQYPVTVDVPLRQAMTKKIVHYAPSAHDVIYVGLPAIVCRVMDHPGPHVTNTMGVLTTQVVAVFADGSFETVNTLYVPATIE